MGFWEQLFGMEGQPQQSSNWQNLPGLSPIGHRGGGPDPAEVQRSKWVQNSAKAVHDALMISPEQAYELKLANRRREKLTEGGLFRQAMAMGRKEQAKALIPEMFGGTIKRVGGKLAHELGSAYKSRIKPAIEAMTQENMLPAQAQGHFNKYPGGVGKDELEYTGVQGMIDAGQPVTKTGLLDQYNANPLQINDVVKTDTVRSADNRAGLVSERDEIFSMFDNGSINRSERDGMLMDAENRWSDPGMENGPTKFSDHTLPGGEDYRELLMTLPTKPVSEAEARKILGAKPDAKLSQADLDYAAKKGSDHYRGGHYDEDDILAHARYNTRTIDGDKTLFGEEFQDDWWIAANRAAKDQVKAEGLAKGSPEFKARVTEKMQGDWEELGVPNRPYKNSGTSMAFKRFMVEAVRGGHDRIAWTPGQVQKDRYDLSKKVGEINYEPSTKKLTVYGKDEYSPMMNETVEPGDLAKHIGKEPAERLLASRQKKYTQDTADGIVEKKHHTIKGKDLELGGEWAEAAYDKMRVNEANKFGKKYGAKVEVKGMGTSADIRYSDYNDKWYHYDDGVIDRSKNWDTEDAAKKALNQEVWSMKITPEMKKALAGGVALSGLGLIDMPGMSGDSRDGDF